MRKVRLLVYSFIVGLVMLASTPVALADTNDFTVTDFSADYYLSNTDPQGALAISEKISVDFTDQNHGIERALPMKYEGEDQQIKVTRVVRDGNAESYTTYTQNGNEVLRIGNANQTITGQHTYEIDYNVRNVIVFTSENDRLIWNTNGTEWRQPFLAITARLHVPTNLMSSFSGPTCYTGAYGSVEHNCTVTEDNATITYQTTNALRAGENMTFTGNFAVGTFSKPTATDWWKDNWAKIVQLVAPPAVAFFVVYPYWRKHGKDLKGRGTIIPEYAPPDDLHAAEAVVINTYKLGTNAITATIIDLAIRKYLRIVEGESKGILGLGKHKTYTFEKLPAPTADTLKPYEKQIYDGIFASGETVEAEELKNQFYKTAQAVQSDIPKRLTEAGYFPRNPKKAGALLFVIAFVVFFGAGFIIGIDWPLGVGIALSAILVGLFAVVMPRRTQKGVEAKDALMGLKLYMETAEKDRIALLQGPNAPYAPTTDAPKQTVELFEKLLPFAIVMGVEKEWAKQFEGIYTTPPDWYNGNWTTFNAVYLASALHDSVSTMNSSFAAPASSSSGSSGGFSGGGGGGGGGGGW